MIERVVSMLRPLTVLGKGSVFDRVTPHSGLRHATVAGSYAMSLDLANAIHRQIYMGCSANAMTRWVKALLRPGGLFLDVGAHAGYFSLIAVEPNPVVFSALRPHLTADAISQVDACNWGLAEREGAIELYVPPDGSVLDYNATVLRRSNWRVIETAARRLDDCLDDWGVQRIDLMKIDVEGSEPRVLAGGAARLASGVVRHAMIEINGPRLVEAGSSPAALVEGLSALGFEPARLVGGRAVRVARTDLDLDPAHECDCLFVHLRDSSGGINRRGQAVSLWQRVIAGDGLRRTRVHDYEQRACGLRALVGLPRAGTSRNVAAASALSVEKPGGYIYLNNSDVPEPEHWEARKRLFRAASTAEVFTDFCDGEIWVTQGLLIQRQTSEC